MTDIVQNIKERRKISDGRFGLSCFGGVIIKI